MTQARYKTFSEFWRKQIIKLNFKPDVNYEIMDEILEKHNPWIICDSCCISKALKRAELHRLYLDTIAENKG